MKRSMIVWQALLLAGIFGLGSLLAQERGNRAARQNAGPRQERATIIKGMQVQNAKGENLGRIADLAITCRDGRVLYAVVDYGGTLGFGQKHLAVPMAALTRETAKRNSHFLLNISKAELDKMPGVDGNDWPTRPDAHFSKGPSTKDAAADRTHFRRSHYLVGMAARNPAGENLGTIRDLMIDCRQGRVIYAALGHGNGIFSTEKYYAVPWQAMDLRSLTGRPADECCVIDADLAALENNGGFNRDHWPQQGDASLFRSIRKD